MVRRRKKSDDNEAEQVTGEESGKGGKDYRFMAALERGLSVLKAFVPERSQLTNTELAEITGIPKSSVSRITYTLMKLGYLKHDEKTGIYTIGPGVLSLGYNVIEQLDIRDIARPFMQELAKFSGGSVYLGVPDGLEILYIEACRAPKSMAISLGVGSRVPMATTGMGRAFLAALPEADLAIKLEELKALHGEEWPEIESALIKEIEITRKRGFSMSRGSWVKEASSAGCAIRRTGGYPLYTINVGGLRSIITDEKLERELGNGLVRVAEKIEKGACGILS